MLDEGSGVIFIKGRTRPRMGDGSTMEVKPRVTVSALARLEIAREKARIMGKRMQPGDGYDLEKAAEQWKRQKELEQRGFRQMNQRSTRR